MNNNHSFHQKIRFASAMIALALFLFVSGCDILLPAQPLPPTATPTQTYTVTPTVDWFPATPTPTGVILPSPTPQPTQADMRAGVTELLVDDKFTDERLWQTQQGTAGNIAYGNENLSLAVAQPSTFLTSLSQHDLLENFYLEITIQTNLCQPADQAGILFWWQSNSNYYRLMMDCAGQVRLELIQDGRNFVVHDWEIASQVQLGSPASNRLGLWVSNGQFQLYVNDIFQFEETIASDQSGKLAVFARTISGSAMTVRFSNLEIYRVETD